MSKPKNPDEVKSLEEWAMVQWLIEATEHGLVFDWEYEPQSFELFPGKTYRETVEMKTKTKIVHRFLCASADYTPDFQIMFTFDGEVALKSVFKPQLLQSSTVWVDVKGTFNPYQNDERFFSLIRKAMFDKYGIWVAKVIPFFTKAKKRRGLFVDTFAPELCRWMMNGRSLNACGRACIGIKEFIDKVEKG